jgi:hypothetical protein
LKRSTFTNSEAVLSKDGRLKYTPAVATVAKRTNVTTTSVFLLVTSSFRSDRYSKAAKGNGELRLMFIEITRREGPIGRFAVGAGPA